MEDISVTASAVISFVEKLEDNSESFYNQLAERFEEEPFQTFAVDSQKNKTLIVRTYQETITDALEACFAFEGLDLAAYVADTALPEGACLEDALRQAIELEDRAIRFYLDVAERSRSLLATIPGAFKRAAKKRTRRKADLESMVKASG